MAAATGGVAAGAGHAGGPRRVAPQGRRAGSRQAAAARGARACRVCCWSSAERGTTRPPLVQTLAQEGIDVRTESSDCLIAATDKLAAEVAQAARWACSGRGTRRPGCAWPTATRGVRAVLATGVAATAAAVSAVGANLLVVDPAVGTVYRKEADAPRVLPRRSSPMSGGTERTTGGSKTVRRLEAIMRIADVIGTVT